MMDIGKEIKNLESEAKRIEEFIGHLQQKLQNERFLQRAPKAIVQAEKDKLLVHQDKLEKIKQQLKTLK